MLSYALLHKRKQPKIKIINRDFILITVVLKIFRVQTQLHHRSFNTDN